MSFFSTAMNVGLVGLGVINPVLSLVPTALSLGAKAYNYFFAEPKAKPKVDNYCKDDNVSSPTTSPLADSTVTAKVGTNKSAVQAESPAAVVAAKPNTTTIKPVVIPANTTVGINRDAKFVAIGAKPVAPTTSPKADAPNKETETVDNAKYEKQQTIAPIALNKVYVKLDPRGKVSRAKLHTDFEKKINIQRDLIAKGIEYLMTRHKTSREFACYLIGNGLQEFGDLRDLGSKSSKYIGDKNITGGSHEFAQWNRGRWARAKAYFDQHGYDLCTQLDYVMKEGHWPKKSRNIDSIKASIKRFEGYGDEGNRYGFGQALLDNIDKFVKPVGERQLVA